MSKMMTLFFNIAIFKFSGQIDNTRTTVKLQGWGGEERLSLTDVSHSATLHVLVFSPLHYVCFKNIMNVVSEES